MCKNVFFSPVHGSLYIFLFGCVNDRMARKGGIQTKPFVWNENEIVLPSVARLERCHLFNTHDFRFGSKMIPP